MARAAQADATIRARLARLDWDAIGAAILERGFATTGRVLAPRECVALAALYDDDGYFRKTIDLARHGFGVGEYRYFGRPLPAPVRELRTHAYRALAPVANRMAGTLGSPQRFPPSLRAFERLCAAQGQTEPTPLLLRYAAGGYNCLHRDLYGEIAFPLQLACVLSRPGVDYEGGSFLLVQQRPRSQSVGDALDPGQGKLVIFASAEHPAPGRRGPLRAVMRHGVARLRRGTRTTLGVIFHDAR